MWFTDRIIDRKNIKIRQYVFYQRIESIDKTHVGNSISNFIDKKLISSVIFLIISMEKFIGIIKITIGNIFTQLPSKSLSDKFISMNFVALPTD